MKILLLSIGSRGDVEPFLALGELLNPLGHDLVYAFPEQYLDLVQDGNRVLPFTRKFLELIEGPAGRAIMGASTGLEKVRDYYRAYRESGPVNDLLTQQQVDYVAQEQPDLIVYHPKCMYPLLHRLTTGTPAVLYCPVPYLVHETGEQPHIAFSKSRGAWFNRMTYRLTNYAMAQKISGTQKMIDGFQPIPRRVIARGLLRQRTVFAVSPVLAPPPPELPDHARVLGFHERNRTLDWTPDRALLDFLDRHPRPLVIGFGSMLTADPPGLTRTICEVLIREKIPALLNGGGGGLVRLPEYQDHPLLHFVDRIPYDWMLPRAGAMIHHGGAGTTHSSLKHGLPTLIIPHIIDQYVWNRRVDELGAGPLGVPVRKLDRVNFGKLVTDLLSESRYRARAEELGAQMRAEDFGEALVRFVLDEPTDAPTV